MTHNPNEIKIPNQKLSLFVELYHFLISETPGCVDLNLVPTMGDRHVGIRLGTIDLEQRGGCCTTIMTDWDFQSLL